MSVPEGSGSLVNLTVTEVCLYLYSVPFVTSCKVVTEPSSLVSQIGAGVGIGVGEELGFSVDIEVSGGGAGTDSASTGSKLGSTVGVIVSIGVISTVELFQQMESD